REHPDRRLLLHLHQPRQRDAQRVRDADERAQVRVAAALLQPDEDALAHPGPSRQLVQAPAVTGPERPDGPRHGLPDRALLAHSSSSRRVRVKAGALPASMVACPAISFPQRGAEACDGRPARSTVSPLDRAFASASGVDPPDIWEAPWRTGRPVGAAPCGPRPAWSRPWPSGSRPRCGSPTTSPRAAAPPENWSRRWKPTPTRWSA